MLIGYLSALGCRAGESVDVMVSGSGEFATIDLVRLLHGDTNPLGPGFLYEEIGAFEPIRIPTREVGTPIGSYAISPKAASLKGDLSLSLSFWPTTPRIGRIQTLVSLPEAGVDLSLDEQGRMVLRRGSAVIAAGAYPLLDRVWYKLDAVLGGEASSFRVAE